MYEFLTDFRRWELSDDSFRNKILQIKDFQQSCISKCDIIKSEIDASKYKECIGICQKPQKELQKFMYAKQRKFFDLVFDYCEEKMNTNPDKSPLKVTEIADSCRESFKENEEVIKKDIMNKVDDILDFIHQK